MGGLLSGLFGVEDAVADFNNGMRNTVDQSREATFQVLNRLNEIIVNNREQFINQAKHAMLQVISQAGDEVKQDTFDLIGRFTYNLSHAVESTIKHAKNATTDLIDESLKKVKQDVADLIERFNYDLSNTAESTIKHAKNATTDVFDASLKKVKQDALDLIERSTYNLSNIVVSAIIHAKNATTDVFDESLKKIRHETDTFVEHIITNRFFILVGIFILIMLLSTAGYLFRRISKDYGCCAQLFEILSNMIMIIASSLALVWFGLSLVWFFEETVAGKGLFYIIVTIILFLTIFYGICHLCCGFKTKMPMGWKWFREEVSKHCPVWKRRPEDLVLSEFGELSEEP